MDAYLSRREWFAACASLAGAAAVEVTGRPGTRQRGDGAPRTIATVGGPVPVSDLGTTLMHEHVLVDFIGADRVSRSRYDPDDVFARVLPHLQQAKRLGCETLVECTPAYLGRDPLLLARLAKAAGLHILTNTGYYGAANDKHVPAHAFDETAEQLAGRWIREAREGIDGSGIKPAFLKIGVDGAPLSAIDAKLVRAAALTHLEVGLPIAAHTTTAAAAFEELDLLERQGVSPSAFIWVHAQAERDEATHVRAASRGAWVELDGISASSVARHVEFVVRMKAAGQLGRTLVSQDAGWYRVGEPAGGEFRPYDVVFTTFVPALKSAGLTDAEVRQLLTTNPRLALTPPVG